MRGLSFLAPWIVVRRSSIDRLVVASKWRNALDLMNSFHRFFVSGADNAYQKSLAAHLVDVCGLQPEIARIASSIPERRTKLDSSIQKHYPELMVAFFRSNGFTDAQIAKIVTSRPILLFRRGRTLKPKMEFLCQLMENDMAVVTKLVCRNTALLTSSLEKRIIPNVEFLKGILLSDKDVMTAVSRGAWLLHVDFKSNFEPNIKALLEAGVTQSAIVRVTKTFPAILLRKTDFIQESIKKVKDIGLHPSKPLYVNALRSISSASKASWERKFEIYESFGLSKDVILSGFVKIPNIMNLSESRINKFMSFFMQRLNMNPEFVLAHPTLLSFSLEKRIIPRLNVLDVLMSNGLLKKSPSILGLLCANNNEFTRKYVLKFQEKCPQLLVAN